MQFIEVCVAKEPNAQPAAMPVFERTVMGGAEEAARDVSIQACPQTVNASTQTLVSDIIGEELEVLISSSNPQTVVDQGIIPPTAAAVLMRTLDLPAGAVVRVPSMPPPAASTKRTLATPSGTLIRMKPGAALPPPLDPPGKPKKSYFSEKTPACKDPDHRVYSNVGPERQRHSCMRCFMGDWEILNTNRFIEPWQKAQLLGTTSRQYVCGLCVLECAAGVESDPYYSIRKQSSCKKHAVFNQQTTCTYHNLPWFRCFQCLHDPRAGKRCCLLCGVSGGCGCPPGPIKLRDIAVMRMKQMPDDQVKLMGQLTKSILEYAALLQATLEIKDCAQRASRVQDIKTTFIFPDASKVRRFVKDAV